MNTSPNSWPTPNNARSVQFVLLRHTDSHGDHYDLMIDEGPHLATWKFSQPPHAASTDQSARRIFNHRRAFLEYEGPLSGDKGLVTRIDNGTCHIHEASPDHWDVTFDGTHLTGRFVLATQDANTQDWSFQAR